MLHVTFSPEKLARMFSLKKVESFSDHKLKLLTGFCHYDIHGYQGFPAKKTLVHLK